MPEISIIVPVYNAEEYLERCINSIINQTFSNFEVILVDDGSSDKSSDICDKYAKADNRVKVIHKENGGVSSARNTGIENALGKYIMFVDSDDYISDTTLETMLRNVDDSVDFIMSSTAMVTRDKTYEFIMDDSNYDRRSLLESYCFATNPQICFSNPGCKLYKRNIINENKIRYNSFISLGEDTIFVFEYLSYVNKIHTVSDILYFYMRDNEDSLFSKFTENYYRDCKATFEKKTDVLIKSGCSDEAVLKMITYYIRDAVGNIIKAAQTANAKLCIDYMKSINKDSFICNNAYLIKKEKKYYALKAVIMKNYYLLYLLIYIRYKLFAKIR